MPKGAGQKRRNHVSHAGRCALEVFCCPEEELLIAMRNPLDTGRHTSKQLKVTLRRIFEIVVRYIN